MTYQHTNREQLVSKLGKHNANRIEYDIDCLCKLADQLKVHLVLDYEPKDSTVKVVVKKDQELEFDNH